MEKENKGLVAIGYIRIDSGAELGEIARQFQLLQDHCKVHSIELVRVLADTGPQGRNFGGEAWRAMEASLKLDQGKVNTLVICSPEMLTGDTGLYLLKQRELKEEYGVTIDVAGSRGQQMAVSLN